MRGDSDTENLSALVLNPSDQYRLSLFGTLNVVAHTQVIPVNPLWNISRVGSQEALAATVLLENLEIGTQVMLAYSFDTIDEGSARFHKPRGGPSYPARCAVPRDGTCGREARNDCDHEDAEYRETDDLYRVSVYYGADIRVGTPAGERCTDRSQFVRPHARVTLTAGGPDWPGWRGVSLNDIARPDTFTNVEGGHSFTGGVYSDMIQVPIRQRE